MGLLSKIHKLIFRRDLVAERLALEKRLLPYFWHYAIGSKRVSYPPLRVRVEPTNRCNLRCVMCPKSKNDQPEQDIDQSLYSSILKQIERFPKPTALILYLGGEPLLNKKLIDMIAEAHRRDLIITLVSNGTLLKEDLIEGLLTSGLDTMSISFDDIPPDEYEKMRRGANYSKTRKGILQLLNMKREKGLTKPEITISSLKLRKDEKESAPPSSQEFSEMFSPHNVSVERSWAHLWAGDFSQKSDYRYGRHKKQIHRCSLVWRDIVLNSRGQAVACCYDITGSHIIGDITSQTIEEIWNGPAIQQLRAAIAEGAYDNVALCRHCSYLYGEAPRNIPWIWRWLARINTKCKIIFRSV